MRFKNKVTLVTGAASGIGRAAALAFAKEGATVFAADINAEAVQSVSAEIEAAGGKSFPLVVDVSDKSQLDAAFETIRAKRGRLDIAFNNAGIDGRVDSVVGTTHEEWNRIIAVNLTSVFLCLQNEITLMADSGGVIVNNASVGGLIGGFNHAAYNASKHGVVGLTKSAAMEYIEHGIRINCVCPGAVRTNFMDELPPGLVDKLLSGTPAARLAEPSEIADAVMWLSSDAATYMVGHALPVDGGTTVGGMSTKF